MELPPKPNLAIADAPTITAPHSDPPPVDGLFHDVRRTLDGVETLVNNTEIDEPTRPDRRDLARCVAVPRRRERSRYVACRQRRCRCGTSHGPARFATCRRLPAASRASCPLGSRDGQPARLVTVRTSLAVERSSLRITPRRHPPSSRTGGGRARTVGPSCWNHNREDAVSALDNQSITTVRRTQRHRRARPGPHRPPPVLGAVGLAPAPGDAPRAASNVEPPCSPCSPCRPVNGKLCDRVRGGCGADV